MFEELYYFTKNLLILSGVLTGGTILATICISKLYWKSFDECIKQLHGIHSLESDSESESEPETIEEKFYNDDIEFNNEMKNWLFKFNEQFFLLQKKDLSVDYLKKLKDEVLNIMTPIGEVVIYYNFENESFEYFSNKKDMPYWFFDNICKAYVVKFDCLNIYTDFFEQCLKLWHEDMDKEMLTNKDEINSVFVKFKNQVDIKTTNFDNLFLLIKNYGGSDKIKYNKLIYKGNLKCWEELENSKKNINDFVNISYKDFLNLKKSN